MFNIKEINTYQDIWDICGTLWDAMKYQEMYIELLAKSSSRLIEANVREEK